MSGFKGKKNIYTCKACRHRTVTVDLDDGVTPFMIECTKCEGPAHSSGYNFPSWMGLDPTHEWYMPDEAEQATLDPETLEGHVKRGGLLLREIQGDQSGTKGQRHEEDSP